MLQKRGEGVMAEEKTIKSTEENPAAENSAAAVFEDEYESVTIRENAREEAEQEAEGGQPDSETAAASLYDRLYAEVSGETTAYTTETGTESIGTGAKNAKPDPEPAKNAAEPDPEPAKKAQDPEPADNAGADPEKKKRGPRFFDYFTREGKYIREQAVLSRIDDEHLMDYLLLEQKRYENEQKFRDERGKRILSAFQLAVSLAAIVAVIGFLKDEPTVLVNILYIIGIVAAIWLWRTKNKTAD
jgi:uncharacterized membrane protein